MKVTTNITIEKDIDSLVRLSFEQLLYRMIKQADAIREGAVRVENGEPYLADEQRLTGASVFAKALAERLKMEHTQGELVAIRDAVLNAISDKPTVQQVADAVERVITKRGLLPEFIDLPKDIPEIDPATLAALKELAPTTDGLKWKLKEAEESLRQNQIKAALDFIRKERPATSADEEPLFIGSSYDTAAAAAMSSYLPEGTVFDTPLYDALVGSLQELFQSLGLTPETAVVLRAEQASHIAGLRDDLRTLTITLTALQAKQSADARDLSDSLRSDLIQHHENDMTLREQHFELIREREQANAANVIEELQNIAQTFRNVGRKL
jgi:hypothetical protein